MTLYSPCHSGNKEIFTSRDVTVLGGGYSKGAKPELADILIDLTGEYTPWVLPSHFTAREHLVTVLSMPIKDFTVPLVGQAFWRALWADLVAEARHKNPLSVLVACEGGHGRTGLVVASLAIASRAVKETDNPIAFVRARLCQEAVETTGQLRYLERIWSFKSPVGVEEEYKWPKFIRGEDNQWQQV